ncbi:MAG TPA: family 10 glycosylhydrolase [Terriglobales bacterium]|nr:family 10 glycosylhydrolase [Terriglobales bacterium]
MNFRRGRSLIIAITCFIVAVCAPCAGKVPDSKVDKPEFRAIWVDGFHAGIRTPEEAAQLVLDAKNGNFNVLIVQVRRRGDAYYINSVEPPVEDPPYDGKFDALGSIIELAHQQGIEVHAWMNAMPVWRNAAPPKNERHAFNLHGPGATERNMWLTQSPDGKVVFPVGYFLDPGNPDAADYLARLYTNVVRNYPRLDGIHFDYVRYPETDEKTSSGRGSPVGYNPASIQRFQYATKRTDMPQPDDEQFIQWRRQQVTQLVRRVYLEAKEINPRIRVSAAVIPWGPPPKNYKDFANVAPMQRVFQDWSGWLKEGILDTAIPMNYAREQDPVTRGYYDGWIQYEKKNRFGRSVVVGVGGYLNAQEDVVQQIERTRKAAGKNTVDGVSIFSYFSPIKREPVTNADATSVPPVVAQQVSLAVFSKGIGSAPAVFSTAVAVPRPQWLESPETGWLAGTVRKADGTPVDGAEIELRRAGGFPLFRRTMRVLTDGNGFYGFSKLKPGRYLVRLARKNSVKVESTIVAAEVARTDVVDR